MYLWISEGTTFYEGADVSAAKSRNRGVADLPKNARTYVVATAVVGDLEDFVGEVFRLTLACEGIRATKFPIAGEPAKHRGFGRHPWVGTDRPKSLSGNIKRDYKAFGA